MNEQEALQLLIKYRENKCTAQERAAVESWLLYLSKGDNTATSIPNDEAALHEIWENIQDRISAPEPVVRKLPAYLKYAAAIAAITIGIATTFYYSNHHHTPNTTNSIATEIMPGGNSATLTLANGKQINLSAANGPVTADSSVLISNSNAIGILSYQLTGSKADEILQPSPETNTITTPAGGQYQLALSDGTRVFLNSSGQLRFPLRFSASERKVFLTGEAYFEVAKDAKRPFLVITEGQQLKVLGTHFNINAYPDELQRTTLVEGSVELTSSSSLQKQLLKPDQQAALLSAGSYKVTHVRAADAIAWKDGVFVFSEIPIREAMLQIARWYNVDTDLSNLPDVTLEAEMSKSLTLSQLLNTIERGSGIKIILSDERRLKISK